MYAVFKSQNIRHRLDEGKEPQCTTLVTIIRQNLQLPDQVQMIFNHFFYL